MTRSFDDPRHQTLALLHLAQDTLLAATTAGAVETNAKSAALINIYNAAAALRSAAPLPAVPIKGSSS